MAFGFNDVRPRFDILNCILWVKCLTFTFRAAAVQFECFFEMRMKLECFFSLQIEVVLAIIFNVLLAVHVLVRGLPVFFYPQHKGLR